MRALFLMHCVFVVELEEFVFVQLALQTSFFQPVLDAVAHVEIEAFRATTLDFRFFLLFFDEISVFVHQQIIRLVLIGINTTAGHDGPHFVVGVRARLEALARLPECHMTASSRAVRKRIDYVALLAPI